MLRGFKVDNPALYTTDLRKVSNDFLSAIIRRHTATLSGLIPDFANVRNARVLPTVHAQYADCMWPRQVKFMFDVIMNLIHRSHMVQELA